MFGSFTGMINKIRDYKIVQNITENITENYAKLKEQMQAKYEIVEVLPQIFHVPFPEKENVGKLKAHIGNSEFSIWNVSEYQYDEEVESQLLKVPQQGQINHLCFAMYSNLPFYELVLSLNAIPNFIRCNKANKVYVHCQDNRIRSAILLTCYIYHNKVEGIEDISDAILWVNKVLKVRLQELEKENMYKNIHLLFRNFVNYRNNVHVINKKQLQILKVIFNHPPLLTINDKKPVPFGGVKVYIEIRCGEETRFKKIFRGTMIEGNLLCISFDKSKVPLSDEFLVIVKYIHEGKMYNILRMQLNTNFICQAFTRVHEQNIDTSPSFALMNPENIMHVDLMFQELQQMSRLALLNEEPSNPTKKEVRKEAMGQLIGQTQAKKAEQLSDAVHSQAIACLNELSLEPTPHKQFDAETLEQQQIAQKIIDALKSAPDKQQRNCSSSEQQDLEDYLSKLESSV